VAVTELHRVSCGQPIRGFCQAREAGLTLAWDSQHLLHLIQPNGTIRVSRLLSQPITDATMTDDGQAIFCVTASNTLSRLDGQLADVWSKTLPHPITAIAAAPAGLAVAVATSKTDLLFYDYAGEVRLKTQTPVAVQHLAIAITEPLLVAAAEFGYVGGYDIRQDQWLWRDGPIARANDLTLSGDGSLAGLASFTEGLRCYDRDGKFRAWAGVKACRAASMDLIGRVVLTSGLDREVYCVNDKGIPLADWHFDLPPAAICLSPLADRATLAVGDALIVFDLVAKG
jgi:hypothetical protein